MHCACRRALHRPLCARSYLGVYQNQKAGTWSAYYSSKKLGTFTTAIEAAK